MPFMTSEAANPFSNSVRDDLAANKALDRRFVDSMTHKDLEGAMACFWNHADTTLVLFDGAVVTGWEEIREAIAGIFEAHEALRLDVEEVTYVRSGDCILAVGTATYRLKPLGAPPRLLKERWTGVRRYIDGRWLYVLDHAHPL